MNETHDTHDLEHVWPPYGVQLAQPEVRTSPDRMLVWCSRLAQECPDVTLSAHFGRMAREWQAVAA